MVARNLIEKLKLDWLEEPSWAIEDTEGFEENRDELLAFRREHDARTEPYNKMLDDMSAKLGVTNFRLLRYLAKLEHRLTSMQRFMEEAKDGASK